jgi:hypothetical protein
MDFANARRDLIAAAKMASHAPLHILLNRTAGSKQGGEVYDQLLAPLFQDLGLPFVLHDQPPSKGMIQDREATVLVVGGDGTLGDLMATLPAKSLPHWSLVVLPFGTANAFYHFLFPHANGDTLASLRHLLAGHPPRPLALAEVASSDVRKRAHVVVSTAFHASILYEADKLRGEVEGIERFKVAAGKSWGRFWKGHLAFTGARYDAKSGSFGPSKDEAFESSEWMYLNVCLTDRLEKEFVVAPRRAVDSTGLDVVTIRRPAEVGLEAFWEGMQAVFAAAYQNGKHVDLTWTEEGKVVDKGEGPAVVDYWRCESLEWTPVSRCPPPKLPDSERRPSKATRKTGSSASTAP